MPLVDQGRVIGFIGFEGAQGEWSFAVNHVMTLRSAAGILAQAFAKRAAEERLAFQAGHDPLTGLPNRWTFLEALRSAVPRLADDPEAAGDPLRGVAVLLFDLDRFKVVNDSLGHRLGDQLLVILAKRLDEARPPQALLARMGGDELVVLAEGVESAAEAVALAHDLRQALSRSVLVEGHEMTTTASVGIAFTSDPAETADDLLRHADAAMYAAKEFGRDRIEVFDEGLRAKVQQRLQKEIDLRQALDHGQLVVHYQPEVEVPSGDLIAVEALVRWNHPDAACWPRPSSSTWPRRPGSSPSWALWVLREACHQQVRWRRRLARPRDPDAGQPVGRAAGPARPAGQGDGDPGRDGHRPGPAVPGDHRDGGHGRRRELAGPRWRSCGGWGWSWPSTTSAPATRRSATSSACP